MESIYICYDSNDEERGSYKKVIRSSEFKARTNFILEGRDLKIGSLEEQFAMWAYKDKQQEKYMGTLVIVKAILQAANIIAAASAGGEAPSNNDIQEILGAYKTLLMPEYRDEQEKRAEKVKEIMEKENEIGSFQVSSLNYNRPKNKKGFR